jgi:hypothetical protein
MLGVGIFMRRTRGPGPYIGIGPPPIVTSTDVRFGPTAGLGIRVGRGVVRPVLEARMHFPVPGRIWGHVLAGIDFVQ